jgi:phosphatidylserine decarboxylase
VIAGPGLKFILAGALITVLLALWAAGKDSPGLLIAAAILGLLTLFLTYFYRNPPRTIPNDEALILSVADGRVLSVQNIENDYIGGKGIKISIFLSVFNVHINRIPISGRVDYVTYNPGKFFAAFEDKASTENEQTEIGLVYESGKMIFKQIAGVLARRIVCHLTKDQSVQAGAVFGMIHFGSRAELFLPDNIEVMVKPGDRVKAGETAIGRLRTPDTSR